MHPSYDQYGLTEADAPYVAAFETWARRQGWPTEQIEETYAWYAAQPQGQHRETMIDSFASHADELGWTLDARDAALVWYAAVEEHGTEAFVEPMPAMADDAKNLADIARVMRDEPNRYWTDPDLQRAHYDILERQAGSTAQVRTEPTAAAQRRREIEALMRDDGRAYWRDEAMQQEYAALLEAVGPGGVDRHGS